MTMGTPLYMSPEQVEGRPLDSRSDIYSFGVTCYHMLAGRPPFEGETALNVAVQHLKSEPQPLEEACPSVPVELSRIVHKMLAKTPEERYASAADLLRDLRQIRVEGWESDESTGPFDLDTTEQLALSDTPIEATRRLEAVMRQSVEMPSPTRRRWLWATILAVGFAGGSALAWATRPSDLLRLGPDQQLPGIQRMPTIEEQIWYAGRKNTKEAWESVWKYFPPNDPEGHNNPYIWRAQKNLARLYRDHGDFELALEIYKELAALDPTEKEFRAVGLAGQAICYERLGDNDELAQVWSDAWKLNDELDTQMRNALRSIGPEEIPGEGP
jgi:serine/threonine-protein kinase